MTEPEKVVMTRWRCTHCGRSWSSRATARQHAGRCWSDPANRACRTCNHFGRSSNGAEACGVGLDLPVIETVRGGLRPVLATHCESHVVREPYAITAANTAT